MGRKSRHRKDAKQVRPVTREGLNPQNSREPLSVSQEVPRQDFLQRWYGKRNLQVALFLALLTATIYGHALHSPFLFDDVPNISRNSYFQLDGFSLEKIREALVKSPNSTRPVSNFSFILNIFLNGHDAASFRLINFLIHAVNGFLLYRFLILTLGLPANKQVNPAAPEIAFWATVLWFVHPLHVQSVTYIVQRMNSLAALFYLLTFLCYIKARFTESENRRWVLAALAMISFLLALGSKEIAVTAPVFIFLYEWFFFQDLSLQWLQKNLKAMIAVVMIIVVTTFAYLGLNPLDTILASYANRNFTLWQRVLTEPRVILHYLDLLILPHPDRLSLLHEFPLSLSLTEPMSTVPALLFLNGLLLTAIILAKRFRLYAFCLLWFFGNLVLESSFIGLEIFFEHRTYLPSMLFMLLMVLLLREFIMQKWVYRAILPLLFVLFSFWTWQRNMVWSNDVSLWQDCLQKHPFEVRIYNALGQALQERGDTAQAMKHFQAALAIDSRNGEALNNLGIALSRLGDSASAIEYFKRAIAAHPDDANGHYNLAVSFGELGYFADAIKHYNLALKINREHLDPDLNNNLGIMLAKIGKNAEAVDHFKKSLQIRPAHPEAHNNLGVIFARNGNYEKAVEHFQAALALNKEDPTLHNRLGLALMFLGKNVSAREHFNLALAKDPGFSLARRNLQKLEGKTYSSK
ncbi:MAG: tetratricopeptide repeat protein [Proteobacteria bacterium]|nr:tetratricopeptide repeat protein [Pseudomonadota bacterium]MBU1739375.1 tetratricopeptide repeat protein [Pseudomonadota bacterium]